MRTSSIRHGALLLSLATSAAGCGSKSPDSPSTNVLNESARTAIAGTVGSTMMAALFAGGAQSGGSNVTLNRIGPSDYAAFPQAATGQTYSTSSCSGGGRVDLVYVRNYVPSGGVIDTSALKAVFTQCVFAGSGSSGQLNGQLTMSGMYQGVDQIVTIRVSGTLTTSSTDCTVDGTFDVTGSFSGTACGAPAKSAPAPTSPSAQAALGSYALSVLDGQALPRQVVDRPCIGYMDSGGLNLKADGTYDMTMHGYFVCLNGDGPKVSYADSGTWAVLGSNTVVFATVGKSVFGPSAASVSGSSASLSLDVPSSAPDIPPTRMAAVFRK